MIPDDSDFLLSEPSDIDSFIFEPVTVVPRAPSTDPYYLAHKDHICARAKIYYQEHREECIDRAKARYLTHRAECIARSKARYQAHREEIIAYEKERRKRLKSKSD